MTGVLIVTHYGLGDEFLNAVRLILGALPRMAAVGLDPQDSPDEMRKRIEATLAELQGPDGVLILTDMFGGTPSNVCLSLLEDGRVEVVTGVNLPMVVKVAQSRDGKLAEVAQRARDYGRRNISVASEVLAGRDRNDDSGESQ